MAHIPTPTDSKYDAHFAAIGRLVDAWAQLEFEIDQSIWRLAQVEQALGACITAQMIGVNGRLRAIRSLLRAHGASDASIKIVGTFAGTLGTLQQKRNRAAHDPRMVHIDTESIDRLEITADNKLVFGFQPESVNSLTEITLQIDRKVDEFRDIIQKCVNEINALPYTSRPPLRQIVPLSKDESNHAIGSSEQQPPPASS